MRFNNLANSAYLLYANEDNQGQLFDVLIAKLSYGFTESFELEILPEQELLNFTDHCYEDFNTSSLMYPSDLVPYKPKTDIIVIANSYPPGGQPMRSWNAGIRVEGEHVVEKLIKVHGPRQWVPKWSRKLDDDEKENWQKYRRSFKGWELSEAEPCEKVPMRYEFAYGGMQERVKDGEIEQIAYEYNPVGTGWIDEELTDHTKPMRAPQLEAVDVPITDPYQQYPPQCLGPIPPAWLPRRPLGGTYDQNWIDNIWPHWPPDYDFAYHNSAPTYLQYPGHMKGNERIQLLNLWSGKERIDFRLPGDQFFVQCIDQEDKVTCFRPHLDTLYIDIRTGDLSQSVVFTVWRFVFLENHWKHINLDIDYGNRIGAALDKGCHLETTPTPSELFHEQKETIS